MSMFKQIIRKIKDEAGESIAEVLVAVLIVAAASIMFASVVSSCKKMITVSDKYFENYYKCKNSYENGIDLEDTIENGINISLSAKSTVSRLASEEAVPVTKKTIKAEQIEINEYYVS